MTADDAATGRAGLQLFGKMSASISHDLKNVLAVINENAGLLEDFCLMAEKGKPLDLARVKRLAGDLKSQIRRGDQIITTLNKFAHSADRESVPIDLGELLGLLAALSLRFASMRGVSLEIHKPVAPVTVTTFPFGLLNLLWLCLDYAMTAAGSGKRVELSAEKTDAGARLRFRELESMAAVPDPFPTEREKALSRALNARIGIDVGSGEIAVSLPNTCRGE
jgi:signal transduction histidine kinase